MQRLKVFLASAPRNKPDTGAFPLDLFAWSLLVLNLAKDGGGQCGRTRLPLTTSRKWQWKPLSRNVDVGALNAGVEKAQGR